MAKVDDGMFWGVGRRKSAIARVRIKTGSGKIIVNDLEGDKYFVTAIQRHPLTQPFKATDTVGKFDVYVNVRGGGKQAQAEAAKLGLARALCQINDDFNHALRDASLMTRDARMKERKKPGLHGARKGTQFSKR